MVMCPHFTLNPTIIFSFHQSISSIHPPRHPCDYPSIHIFQSDHTSTILILFVHILFPPMAIDIIHKTIDGIYIIPLWLYNKMNYWCTFVVTPLHLYHSPTPGHQYLNYNMVCVRTMQYHIQSICKIYQFQIHYYSPIECNTMYGPLLDFKQTNQRPFADNALCSNVVRLGYINITIAPHGVTASQLIGLSPICSTTHSN